MKKIKVTLSIGVLMATMAVIGMSSSQVAFAEVGVKCSCMYPSSGEYGVYQNNDCVVQNCFLILVD